MQTSEMLVALLVPVTLILATAGVLIFRPMSKRVAERLVERRTAELSAGASSDDIRRLVDAVETLSHRLEQIEARQQFTDRLLEGRTRDRALSDAG